MICVRSFWLVDPKVFLELEISIRRSSVKYIVFTVKMRLLNESS